MACPSATIWAVVAQSSGLYEVLSPSASPVVQTLLDTSTGWGANMPNIVMQQRCCHQPGHWHRLRGGGCIWL
jgi:hypothetical protein